MSSARRRFGVLFLLVALATPGWAQEEAPDIGPGHTYARLMLLAAELELIRAETGKQSPGPTGIDIRGVAPREVYFQAVALFQKANRLSFEYARETAEQPPLTKLDITPAQVMLMIDAALERVLHVKRELNIPESSVEPPIDETLAPTDVFNATLEVSRQLDEILDQPFSPSEVYQQVTLAIGYAARLRARFPGERIPGPPPFERAKQPSHVLYKLFDCFRLVQGLAERSQLRMLEFNVADTFNLEIEPTDVYNMATFLVSQIRYLWLQLDAPQLPRPVYHPGRKLPSHVYQRAGLLERQLLELTELVEANPGWLEKE